MIKEIEYIPWRHNPYADDLKEGEARVFVDGVCKQNKVVGAK